ncbi:hypothetical protein Tco_0116231 [Tanacetum coccineum]
MIGQDKKCHLFGGISGGYCSDWRICDEKDIDVTGTCDDLGIMFGRLTLKLEVDHLTFVEFNGRHETIPLGDILFIKLGSSVESEILCLSFVSSKPESEAFLTGPQSAFASML